MNWCWSWSSSSLATWVKSQLIGKDRYSGKDWGQKEKKATEDEMVRWHRWLSDMSLSKLREIVKDREAWHAAVHGVTKSWTWLSNWTELNWTSLWGSSVHGILQARILEWVAISFSRGIFLTHVLNPPFYSPSLAAGFLLTSATSLVVVQSLSHVQPFETPWTIACQAPLSMELSKLEYWSGLPFPSPGESSQPKDRICVSCISRRVDETLK